MPVADVCLDRVRVAGGHGVVGQVDQAGAAVELGVPPAHAVGALLFGGGVQVHQLLQALAAHVAGLVGDGQAALGPDGAEQGVDDVRSATDVERIVVAGHHPAGVPDDARRGLGQLAGQRGDGGGGHAGFAFRPLRGARGHVRGQRVQVLHVRFDVGLVVQALVDQHVDDGQVEGQVAAGAHHVEIVGLARGVGGANVHHAELAALFQAVQHRIGLGHVDGFKDVAGLQDEMLAVAVVVDHFFAADAHHRLGGVLHVARAGAVVVAVVGRSQAAHERLVQVHEGAAPVGPLHAAAAVFGGDGLQLAGHVVQGFVPRGFAPLALAAFAHADQRALRTLRVHLEGDARRAARTQRPFQGGLGVALYANGLAVLHLDHDGTAHAAHAAYAVHLLPACHGCLRCLPAVGYLVELDPPTSGCPQQASKALHVLFVTGTRIPLHA